MYLSRIALDDDRRETMRALATPSVLHACVESCFKENQARNLWRVDWLNDVCYLLILSRDKPDLTRVAGQFGRSSDTGETKDYDPFLERIDVGQVWQFRLCANPVKSSSRERDESNRRGQVFAHVTQTQRKQWLMERSLKNGFELTDDGFDVVRSQWLSFGKGEGLKQEVTLSSVTFEGTLLVADRELLKNALINGIGRAKAYGCGLLTLAKGKGGVNE